MSLPVYAYDWNDVLIRPMIDHDAIDRGDQRQAYTEEEARDRHQRGELYSHLTLDDDGGLRRKVQIKRGDGGYAHVVHYDPQGRVVVDNTFSGSDDGRLFLSTAHWQHFPDAQAEAPDRFQQVKFTRDGGMEISYREPGMPALERLRARNPLTSEQMEALWEPVPEFGDYESIARVERDLPTGSQDS